MFIQKFIIFFANEMQRLKIIIKRLGMKTKFRIIAIACLAVVGMLFPSFASTEQDGNWSLENIEALSRGEELGTIECLGNGSVECPTHNAKVKVTY